jgi:hypothetical protein
MGLSLGMKLDKFPATAEQKDSEEEEKKKGGGK